VSNVTDVPATVHTAVVNDENDTGRPDDAVALTVTGDCARLVLGGAGKVIVCEFFETVKLCCTGGAGSKLALPA
jgi:hypothetical protein